MCELISLLDVVNCINCKPRLDTVHSALSVDTWKRHVLIWAKLFPQTANLLLMSFY